MSHSKNIKSRLATSLALATVISTSAAAHPDHSDGFANIWHSITHWLTQPDHIGMILLAGVITTLWFKRRSRKSQ